MDIATLLPAPVAILAKTSFCGVQAAQIHVAQDGSSEAQTLLLVWVSGCLVLHRKPQPRQVQLHNCINSLVYTVEYNFP